MLNAKHRPRSFEEVVGQESIVDNLREQSKQNKYFPVYILCGQFGSGKTTISRIIKLVANCNHKDSNGNPCLVCEVCQSILNESTMDCLEIDGASNNGVDNIRELNEFCNYRPVSLKYKVIVIDEVHMLSKGAFNAFLKTLEEPPSYCIFVLCTTEKDAIPATVRSRAATYIFKRIETEKILNHLSYISIENDINIEKDALSLIAKYSYGAMRDALSLLEQSSFLAKYITVQDIKNLIGIESHDVCFELLMSMVKKRPVEVVQLCNKMDGSGIDFHILINDLLSILADSVVYVSTNDVNTINNTTDYISSIQALCTCGSLDTLFYITDELQELKTKNRNIDKNTILVKLLQITQDNDNIILERIKKLESGLETIMSEGIKTIPVSSLDGSSLDIVDLEEYDNQLPKISDDVINDTCSVDTKNTSDMFQLVTENAFPTSIDSIDKLKKQTQLNEPSETYHEELTFHDDDIDFNIFDLWEDNSTNKSEEISEDTTTVCNKEIDSIYSDDNLIEKDVIEDSNDSTELEELRSDSMVAAALSSCNIKKQGNRTIIFTSFKPLQRIIQSFITAKKFNSITVEISEQDN